MRKINLHYRICDTMGKVSRTRHKYILTNPFTSLNNKMTYKIQNQLKSFI